MPWPPTELTGVIVSTAIFGALGIILILGGFKLFDWMLPRVDFQEELLKGNMAVAIIAGAGLIAVALVIAAAVGS